MRNTAVLEQPDNRGDTEGETSRLQEMSVLLFGHGHYLEHKNNRAASRADIDRLIGSVQHEHRGVQCLAVARLMSYVHRLQRQRVPAVSCRIVQACCHFQFSTPQLLPPSELL